MCAREIEGQETGGERAESRRPVPEAAADRGSLRWSSEGESTERKKKAETIAAAPDPREISARRRQNAQRKITIV